MLQPSYKNVQNSGSNQYWYFKGIWRVVLLLVWAFYFPSSERYNFQKFFLGQMSTQGTRFQSLAHQLEDENIQHDKKSSTVVSRLVSIIWAKRADWRADWNYFCLGGRVVWHTRTAAEQQASGEAWLKQGTKNCFTWKEVMNRGWLRLYSQDNAQLSTQPVSALQMCIRIWNNRDRQQKNPFKVQMTYKTLRCDWKSTELIVARGRHKGILWF